MESSDNKFSHGAISLWCSEFKYSLKAGKVSFKRAPKEMGNGTRSVRHVLRVKCWDSGPINFLHGLCGTKRHLVISAWWEAEKGREDESGTHPHGKDHSEKKCHAGSSCHKEKKMCVAQPDNSTVHIYSLKLWMKDWNSKNINIQNVSCSQSFDTFCIHFFFIVVLIWFSFYWGDKGFVWSRPTKQPHFHIQQRCV